jgi:uncharacterized membrane protein SpoIIM required for sporulation
VDVDSFIRTHRPDWDRLEQLTGKGGAVLKSDGGTHISEAIRLYLMASTDLTEARARYVDPQLVGYLNALVARARQAVYSARPTTVHGFITLFGARYRTEIRRTLPYILVATAVLVGVVLVTWAWIAWSPAARAGAVPPAAQDAVQRFTGGRAPGLGPAPALSSEILVNNVIVAFNAFALGITAGIGTVLVLVQNAVLLGMLAGAFQAAGKGAAFWAIILPHGLLELTAICIAAGAGLRMGWSLIDPGDLRRGAALAEAARGAVIVVIGVIPAFVIAACIEGFLTGTAVPDLLEVAIGVVVTAAYVAFLVGRRAPDAS